MTALRCVAWLAAAPDHAQQYTCHLCNTQRTIPPRKELLGCRQPIETSIAGPTTRPGERGGNRMLHVGPLGIRTWRCPRAWALDPMAIDGWQAYVWWEKGQLAALYAPGHIPAKAIEAVDVIRVTYAVAHDAWWERRRAENGNG